MRRRYVAMGARLSAVIVLSSSIALFGASCGGDPSPNASPGPSGPQCATSLNTNPEGAPWVPAADPADPVTASFEVTIDPAHTAFMTEQREPLAAPMTVTTKSGTLKVWGGVKKFVKHAERLFVELYFVNDEKVGWRDTTVTVDGIAGASTFYDFDDGVWADPTAERTLRLGGIAPEGSARITFGFDAQMDNAPIKFTVNLAGKTTRRVSIASAPIVVTLDGKEVWAVQGDADVVAVIDTATDKRVAQIKTPGKPSSVAVTPDGKLALVACSACNQVSVIDTATREIVQVFGENDGIGRDPRNVVVSPDGTRAYVSAYVGNTVTVMERVGDAFRVIATTDVGRRPLGISVTPDGTTAYVAHFMPRGKIGDNMAWISTLDGLSGKQVGEIELRDDGNVKESECLRLISIFSQYTAEELTFEGTPSQLTGFYLDPSGSGGWAPGIRLIGFPVFEGNVTNIGFQFITLGANSPPIMFLINTRDPRAGHPVRLESTMDFTDRDEAFLRCFPAAEATEAVTAQPVGSDPTVVQNPGTATPSVATPLSETGVVKFIGYTRGGRRALMLSHAADEIMVADTATRSPTSRLHFELKGSNPTGIAITPDGSKGYVSYENSLFVSALDLSAYSNTLPELITVPYRFDYSSAAGQGGGLVSFGRIVRPITDVPERPPIVETAQINIVDQDPMDPIMRRGKVLFTSSNPNKYPTLSGNREATCSACHPDGGNDGSIWTTVEGERRTLGLWGGTAGRGWLHWSATHHDATDFAGTIVKERLGGKGLSDEDKHALSHYVAYGIPEVQRPKVDTVLAAAGKSIFSTRCAACHDGPKHTSGEADPESKYGGGVPSGPTLYDVGSATDWAGAGLGTPFINLFATPANKALSMMRGDRDLGTGDWLQEKLQFEARPDRKRGQIKSPSLVNVWENATFFHDSRTDSLEEAVQDIASRTGQPLNAEDLKAVVEYLKTL